MIYPSHLQIVYDSHMCLHQKSGDVTEFDQDLKDFCDRLLFHMKRARGLGLAAPQVKTMRRIFVTNQKPCIWINPVISKYTGSTFFQEGCLSYPHVYFKIKRYRKIVVDYFDVDGTAQQKKLDGKKGMLSVVVQHEIDHLNGITFMDLYKEASNAASKNT